MINGHPVGDAVGVLVDARDRDPHSLADSVRVAEDRLRHAVRHDDRRKIGRKARSGRRKRDHSGCKHGLKGNEKWLFLSLPYAIS
jgi:hypothetical protein